MIHFAWPWLFLLLPLPWLLRRWLPAAAPAQGGVLYAPFAPSLAAVGTSAAVRPSPVRIVTLLLIWLLLLTAAARPQWLGEPTELPETGRNLMLAADLSGSMETPDLDIDGEQATRLDAVKSVAGAFIERRKGDRIGLILFGSQAYLQAPLTFDRTTVHRLLNQAMIGIAGRETAIGDAIGLAIKRLRQAPEGMAVLILLTDGANTAGRVPPRQAAELAAQAGLKIYTIGIGAEKMRVRGLFGSRIVNPSADLDEETLGYIADTTGGKYFRARDLEALQGVYQQIDALEPVAGGSRLVRPITSLYPWPLSGSLLLSLFTALTLLWSSTRPEATQ
ncbi:MAG: VWA domain-containing protein [Sedimenticola sp.]